MTSRRSPIAILVAVVVLLTGYGTKTAKKAEPEAPPTAAATPAEPPPVQEQQPAAEPPAPAPQPITASPRATQPTPSSGPPESVDEFTEEMALQDVFFEAGRADIGPSRARFMKENARWILENRAAASC